VAGFDNDPLDLSLVKLGHKLAKNDILFRRMSGHAEQIEQQNHEKADDNPEK